MRLKKAQIQMMETVFVLLIVFIILGFGLIFYGKYSQGKVVQAQRERLSVRAVDASLRSALLPEIQCSRNGQIEPNCLDKYKVGALSELIKNNELIKSYYFDTFRFSNITLTKLYPLDSDLDFPITLYINVPNNITNVYTVTIPITIQDASQYNEEINIFGELVVQVYE